MMPRFISSTTKRPSWRSNALWLASRRSTKCWRRRIRRNIRSRRSNCFPHLALEGRRNKAQGERTREPWELYHGPDPRVREYAHPGLYYDALPGLKRGVTMDKRKILIQLDTDAQPSVFDRVVAIDAGADEVFSYGGVRPEQVQGLVHGAIFTRGPKDLKRTALFIGGSDVAA